MVRTVLAAVCLTAVLAGSAHASPITADYTDAFGNVWANLSDTTGFTWDEISTVCPVDGATACSGILGTTDFTGWVWPRLTQVNNLFKELTGLGSALDDFSQVELNSTWAPQIFAALTPTIHEVNGGLFLRGWAASQGGPTSGHVVSAADRTAPELDHYVASNFLRTRVLSGTGVFLFQPDAGAAVVPEPTSMLLLGTGVAALVMRRRRR